MASSIADPAVRFLANKAIMVARAGIARVQDFTSDFTADAAQTGSTMLVQFFDDGTAGAFNRNSNNYGNADGKSSFIPVKFSNHLKKTFEFTPEDYLNIGSQRFERAGEACGRAISRGILHATVKLINPTNIPTSGTDTKTEEDGTILGTQLEFGAFNEKVCGTTKFTKDYVAEDLGEACDAADIDAAESVLLLNGKEYGQLLATLDAHVYGDPAAIQAGRIAGLYGFRAVVKVDSLTTVAGGNLRGAIVPANAIGLAGRVVPVLNPQEYQEVGTVTDDLSGLVIGFRRGGDWKTDVSDLTGECLFGAKLLQPTKIVRLVSSTPVAPTGPSGATGATGDAA